VKGKLTPNVIELYYRYAEQRARTSTPAGKVNDDFWKWFDASPVVRKGILAGMDCAYAGHAIGRLAELRSEFGADVDRHSQLAIAFALVYGRAGDESILLSIRGRPRDARGRPAPSMIESFRYYTDHKGEMVFPLQGPTWPLLVHVADNDVPIVERDWVLSRYRGRPLKSLGGLYGEPRYTGTTGAPTVSKEEGTPVTLPMILEHGGACLQKSYYAKAVLKSLGVPAFRVIGRAHAWEGCVLPGKSYVVAYHGGPHKFGRMNCPLTRASVGLHEVEMRVAAASESYTGYLDARIAAAAYAMVPQSRRSQATGLLRAALVRNGHCTEVWRHLAQACVDGLLGDAEARELYPSSLRGLAEHPQMTYEIFTTLISPKLRATKNVDERAFSDIARAIEREARRYERLNRDDLGVRLRNRLGSYAAAVKGSSAVCKLYHSWLGVSESRTKGWYMDLVRHLINLTRGKEALPYRAKFLADELARQPARFPPSSKARKRNPKAQGKLNERYVLLAATSAKTLRVLGREDEAGRIEAEVAQLTGKEK